MKTQITALLAASMLWGLPAQAQTNAVLPGNTDHGVTLPPTSASFANDALSTVINPAGVSDSNRLQFYWLHDRSLAKDRVSDGIYVSDTFFNTLGVGFNHEWVRGATADQFRKFGWSFSLGSPWASFGVTSNWFHSDVDLTLQGQQSWDMGFLVRPARPLSLAFVWKNFNHPANGLGPLPQRYDIALGLRPFGERLSLAADLLFNGATGINRADLAYTLQAEVIRGFTVNAGFAHNLGTGIAQFQVGLTLDFPHSGFIYAFGGSQGRTDHVVGVRLSAEKFRSLPISDHRIVLVDLPQELSGKSTAAMALLGIHPDDPFVQLIHKLNAMAQDDRVAGVVFKVDMMGGLGMGRAEELRQAFRRLRAQGKRLFVYLLGASDVEYTLASAADRIYAAPEAMLAIDGFAVNATFIGSAMEKLGVEFDVARVGAYKNAPDMFTRSGMSAEQREAMNAFLDSVYRSYERAWSQGRSTSSEKLASVLRQGLLPPERAREMGVVDAVVVPQDLENTVEREVPRARLTRRYDPWDVRDTRWGPRPKIAIVPVIGNILGGASRRDPLGLMEVAGAESVIRALETAQGDPTVKAIVLRVDSPGGSVLASDLMYRAILQAKKRKPVIASMGDLAASGGYYVAMGADRILASPTTLTGSIGVFFLKPAVEKLALKLGVHRETLLRGPLANMMGDIYKPWSPAEREVVQSWVDSTYDQFIRSVAMNRKMDKAKVHAIAQGRVWSGEDALKNGLVDQEGGLWEAVEIAAQRAGLKSSDGAEWVLLSDPKGPFAQLASEDGITAKVLSGMRPPEPLPEALRTAAVELGFDPTLLCEPGTKAMLPFSVRVR